MNVELVPATRDDLPRLRALFQLYAHDFSEILPLELDEDARYPPYPLDVFFTDGRRHAFLLRVDGALAGFALMQERSALTGDESACDVCEFFVVRRHRRRGVGERAAHQLFDRFARRWEVREKRENVAGAAFWRRAIDRYTGGRFDETMLDDATWRGPVQHFDAGARVTSSRRNT